jgi:Cu2+-containing amine oxidase
MATRITSWSNCAMTVSTIRSADMATSARHPLAPLTTGEDVELDEPARVTSAAGVPGAQPPVAGDEFFADGERIKEAPEFRAALARRGLTDMSAIQVDAWPASNFGLAVDKSGRRLARAAREPVRQADREPGRGLGP